MVTGIRRAVTTAGTGAIGLGRPTRVPAGSVPGMTASAFTTAIGRGITVALSTGTNGIAIVTATMIAIVSITTNTGGVQICRAYENVFRASRLREAA